MRNDYFTESMFVRMKLLASDGNWKALWNGEIWKNNTVLGSIYNAALRTNLEKLGYETQITGKHGQFEIKGVPRDVIDAFSQRRQDILATAARLGRSRRLTSSWSR